MMGSIIGPIGSEGRTECQGRRPGSQAGRDNQARTHPPTDARAAPPPLWTSPRAPWPWRPGCASDRPRGVWGVWRDRCGVPASACGCVCACVGGGDRSVRSRVAYVCPRIEIPEGLAQRQSVLKRQERGGKRPGIDRCDAIDACAINRPLTGPPPANMSRADRGREEDETKKEPTPAGSLARQTLTPNHPGQLVSGDFWRTRVRQHRSLSIEPGRAPKQINTYQEIDQYRSNHPPKQIQHCPSFVLFKQASRLVARPVGLDQYHSHNTS